MNDSQIKELLSIYKQALQAATQDQKSAELTETINKIRSHAIDNPSLTTSNKNKGKKEMEYYIPKRQSLN